MNLGIIGCGYVGLVVGTCLADLGNNVICSDSDESKISKLKKGIPPIYETGLRDMIERNLGENRMSFTSASKDVIQKSDVIFIAVGTPRTNESVLDMSQVRAVAKDIGTYINGYKVIVNKSTVPVGTADEVAEIIKQNQKISHDFDVVSNPEFLREGDAIRDFSSPDRIVVGVENERSRAIMEALYKGITRTGKPILFTNTKTAELIKYASNAMLATRISFMNHLVPFCEKTGADIKQVAKGMGLDGRIGPRFLQAGVGYGGSCFPKDISALVWMMEKHECAADMLKSVIDINEMQKKSLIPKVQKLVPKLKGTSIAIWGLAFKPKTDDMRDAPSVIIIEELKKLGAKIRVFDPEAMDNAKKILKDVEFCKTPYDTVKDCSAVLLVTEWNVFRDLDLKKVKSLMKLPNIIDGRNIYDCKDMENLGFNYGCVGR